MKYVKNIVKLFCVSLLAFSAAAQESGGGGSGGSSSSGIQSTGFIEINMGNHPAIRALGIEQADPWLIAIYGDGSVDGLTTFVSDVAFDPSVSAEVSDVGLEAGGQSDQQLDMTLMVTPQSDGQMKIEAEVLVVTVTSVEAGSSLEVKEIDLGADLDAEKSVQGQGTLTVGTAPVQTYSSQGDINDTSNLPLELPEPPDIAGTSGVIDGTVEKEGNWFSNFWGGVSGWFSNLIG